MSEEKKLTDEEIVKALKCCIASPIGCDECPLIQGDEAYCSWILDVALDLIHRLQGEIAELQKQVDELNFDKNLLQKLLEKREKDTAKEICDLILEHWEAGELIECDWLRVAISEKYGMEVE